MNVNRISDLPHGRASRRRVMHRFCFEFFEFLVVNFLAAAATRRLKPQRMQRSQSKEFIAEPVLTRWVNREGLKHMRKTFTMSFLCSLAAISTAEIRLKDGSGSGLANNVYRISLVPLRSHSK